jgi:hypothetical protein
MISSTILQTLKYSDHFNFPLTLAEIHERLIGTPISQMRLIRQIRLMLKAKSIAQTGAYYHLPGQKSLVVSRLNRAQFSASQLARAKSLALHLTHVPNVLAIYLTGSLAMQNSDVNSDIDFMIITQNGRLWTTRLLLTLYTSWLGLRRTPGSTQNSGKLCLNLYLTPTTYDLPPTKQSLYTAYELVQTLPLYDPHNTRPHLLSANPWISTYLPNVTLGSDLAPRSDLLRRRPEGVFSRLQNTIGRPGQTLMELLELISYHLQLWYMRPKLTREYVTPNSAFFHPYDPAPKV